MAATFAASTRSPANSCKANVSTAFDAIDITPFASWNRIRRTGYPRHGKLFQVQISCQAKL